MRNTFRVLGVIVMTAIIGFSMAACEEVKNDPSLVGKPVITGAAQVGRTLTASTVGMNGTGTYSYEWKRRVEVYYGTRLGYEDIDIGTDSPTYKVVADDLGATITVSVTCTDFRGDRTSDPTVKVESTWTVVEDSTFGTSYQDSGIEVVIWDGSRFIAGGANGKLAFSADGVTWTGGQSSLISSPILSMAYGNGIYAAGWYGMTYSEDGENWEGINSEFYNGEGNNKMYGYMNDLIFADGKFVAVGEGRQGLGDASVYPGQIKTSTDAKNWTSLTAADAIFGNFNIFCIAYGAGKFVAGGRGGKMATSPDGTNWTAVADSKFGTTSYDEVTSDIDSIAYGGGKFVAAGAGAKNKMATSTDGTTWTALTVPLFEDFYIRRIVYAGNKFFAMGTTDGPGSYATGSRRIMAYSTNGTTWTVTDSKFEDTIITNNSVSDIAWGGAAGQEKFVAVGGYGRMAWSTTGE